MLEELRIRSLGVIEEAVLELGPGLTVITGETGAGKTMVVSALGLLLGGRADSGTVRAGADRARVEGLVHLDADGPGATALDRLEQAGGDCDDGRLVLARQVSAEGRSRAFAGGTSVPVGVLAELSDPLVAMHGQSDQHRLLRPSAQREALDRFAGAKLARLAEDYAAAYQALRSTEAELADVVAHTRERAREADLLRFGLAEVETVDPQPGEETALAEEETRLGNADTLRGAAVLAREALSSLNGGEGGADALALVAAARAQLDGVREHDARAGELADRVAEISYLLSDVAADVASYASGVDSDPARLAAVSERRAALLALTRKYAETVDDVLAWARDAGQRLLQIDGTDERVAELTDRRTALRSQLAGLAASLSAERAKAADRLGRAVLGELSSLAMPHAVLRVVVSRVPDEDGLELDGERVRFTASGVDEVEFTLSANRGTELRPLAKSASGGELSRVMLALEVSLAETRPVPTFVFDEVDAGVGGKAAVEVGRRLAQLARHAQVLVVTHLPQVAAFADHHVVVVKSGDGSVTTSGVSVADGEARVRELSRMLAGLEDSETARAHAEELLAAAQQSRAD
ncbi:MAG TPA: DNA repair protein RecN [Nocardioidaceae bacterium]|nr:DNA repair protein RecN [Nocardioidaceae bacterium]